MSHLFNHNGAENTGYSQPAPLACATAPQVPQDLFASSLLVGLASQNRKWSVITWLSKRNFGIDTGFYPLGSCTMKHNPRVNEVIAQLPGIADIHPHQPEHHLQVCFQFSTRCSTCWKSALEWTKSRFSPWRVHKVNYGRSVHSSASKWRSQRTKVIVPDSAHGTNPASAALMSDSRL